MGFYLNKGGSIKVGKMALAKFFKAQFKTPLVELHKTLQHQYAKDGGYLPRIRGVFIQLLRMNELKHGELVGEDALGNKYYENNRYFLARNRWVDYNQSNWKDKWDFNASMVAPEWHRWLHHMTDDPPTLVPPTPRKFLIPHVKNLTGTKDCHVPYSTVAPKIEAW